MFGIGAQEMVIIGLLALLVFGPHKLPQMARELGGFARKARGYMEELRSEIVWQSQNERTARRKARHEQTATLSSPSAEREVDSGPEDPPDAPEDAGTNEGEPNDARVRLS